MPNTIIEDRFSGKEVLISLKCGDEARGKILYFDEYFLLIAKSETNTLGNPVEKEQAIPLASINFIERTL